MADCAGTEYQLIEYLGLADLQGAQIVQAQIDSIDVVTKLAAITIVEECEKNSWIPLEDVPFYYHCETSTGTVEDLALGYKAFSADDFVYVLAIPEREGNPSQVYIVGHVDIRGTYRCVSDMLLITLPYTVAGVGSYTRFTIFDIGLGAQLDIATFENVDGSSPDKPESLPAVYNTAATDWISYNFDTVSSSVSVPRTVSKVTLAPPGGTTVETLSETTYTGEISKTVSSGDGCAGFSLGNEACSYTLDQSLSGQSYGTITIDQGRTLSGADTFHFGGDNKNCAVYWGSSIYSAVTEYHNDTSNTVVVRIVDNVLSQTFDLPLLYSIKTSTNYTFTCDGNSYQIDCSGRQAFSLSVDAGPINGPEISRQLYYDMSAETTGTGPGTGGAVNLNVTGFATRRIVGDPREVYLDMYQWNPQSLVGRDGVYSLFGAAYIIPWHIGSTYYLSSPGYSGAKEVFPEGMTIPGWGGVSVLEFNKNVETGTRETEVGFFPLPYITIFDDTFDLSVPVSIKSCFEKANPTLSDALASALVDFVANVLTEIGNSTESLDYNYTNNLKYGPTVSVIARKRE